MKDFKRNLAVVIGINEYQDYPKLQTARYDAERLAEILAIEHNYDYVILAADDTYKEYRKGQELPVKNKYQPTLNGLLNLLSKRLPAEINPTKEDRLLFYFAGHGIPDDSDEGPKGYLVPLDADSKKRDSLLPMQELYKYLAALNCRHFLIVLDCCFAGRFRWESTRKGRTFPRVIHKEHYDRFINSPAWQAITSASHDQEAFDILSDNRGTVEGTNHSPFAEGLFKALQGEADVFPASKNGQPAGDGVITATELYLYLRDHVEIGSKERQTPGLWTLPKHDRGEYIFLVPGANPNLKPAPNVNEKNNPYRGLESFEEEHSQFFFGRQELIEQLSERISAPKQPLTVVSGLSGSGKSSLVKAGLIPCLRKLSKSEVFEVNLVSACILTSAVVQAFSQVSPKFWPINYAHQWRVLKPMRPGEQPFKALAKAILPLADVTDSNQSDTLNFLKVSDRLDTLIFITEVLKQKFEDLDEKIAESSHNNGEESAETLRLKKEVEKLISITQGWKQGTQKAKQLLIVEHFEELYTLCRNPKEQQQLQQAVEDCLNRLSQSLQSDPNQLIDIVRAWSQKNPGVRLLLTIDQLEELITLSQNKQKDQQNKQQQQKKLSNQPTQAVQQENKQEEWQQFLNLLEKTLSAKLEQLRIIVTLRSDFESRFLNSDRLKSYWAKARFPVRAMRSDELRQAIERPAAEMALYFEPPNLVDKLIDEVGQMPGALPLLSFTLSELYIKLAQKWGIQETSDRALTLDADFDKEGGVAGSLTRRANQEYDKLPDDAQRATLRRVMLRMVTTEGGESARRRVPLSELVYADATENERVKLVLELFNHVRLIVSGQETGEPYVEPAHDFLVRSWDKLQKWQQEEQQDLPLQRRLTPAALEWKSKEQSSSLLGKTESVLSWVDKKIDSIEDWLNQIKKNVQERRRERKGQFLWNGNPYLDVLKKRLKSYDHWFNQVETEFVQQSLWQKRRNVNLRWGIAIAVFLGLSGLTIRALIAQRQALIEQMTADRNSTQTLLGTNQLTLDALISSLRAGKSLNNWLFWELFQPEKQLQNQVIGTLRTAFYTVRERNRWQLPQDWVVQDSVTSQEQKLLVAATNNKNEICVRDIKSLHPEKSLCYKLSNNQGLRAEKVKFSPDSKKLVVISVEQGKTEIAYLWDLEYKRVYSLPLQIPEFPEDGSLSFSSDSRKLALINNRTAYLWDWENHSLTKLQDNVIGINFRLDDHLLMATTGQDGHTIQLFDYSSQKYEDKSPYIKGDIQNVIISNDGKHFAVFRRRNHKSVILLWSMETENTEELDLNVKLSFSNNGKELAITHSDGTIHLLDSGLFKELQVIKGYQGSVSSLSFVPDGKQILTSSNDGTLSLWNIESQKPTQSLTESIELSGSFDSLKLSPDGKQIATLEAGMIRLWNVSSGQELKLPNLLQRQRYDPKSYLSLSQNDKQSTQLAILEPNRIHLWDLSVGKEQVYPISNTEKIPMIGSLSPDGKQLAIAEYYRGIIHLLNLVNGQRDELKCEHDINGFIWTTNNKLLVTHVGTDSVEIWDGYSSCRKQLASLQLKNSLSFYIQDPISFSSDGNLVYIPYGDEKDSDILWDWQSNPNLYINLGIHSRNLEISTDGNTIATLLPDNKIKLWKLGGLNTLLQRGCEQVRDYLATLDENNSDRHLCDDIPPSTPSPQTTIANSSAPSIVQPSAQNAPSPAPLSNNGQDTPSLSAPTNAPARPQNVPSPTPSSNNGQNSYRQPPSDRKQPSKLNSTSVDAYINQGSTYYRQGNYQQAISSYSQAIALNPNSATAYSNRASAYIGQKDYPKAIADSSKAIILNPTYANAYIYRGLAYFYQRNYQQAIADYTQATKLDPSNANAYISRGQAYYYQRNYQQAIADYNKAIELAPSNANDYLSRGLAYYYRGNYQQAIADYNKAIELAPSNANAYNYRASAYASLGNQQAAQADKRKAAALSQRQSQ